MTHRASKIAAFVAGALLLLIGAPIAERALLTPGPGEKLHGKLSQVQEQAIESSKDVATLLINWAFVLLGFYAWFIRRAIEGTGPLKSIQKWSCATGVVAAGLSIFFGQAALSGIALLMESDIFSVANRAVQRPATLQFVALLFSVACASIVIIDDVFWPDARPGRIVMSER